MTDIAIKVENISKQYRIGLKEELHDSLIGKVGSFLKNPFSNLNRLKKLSHFDNDQNQDDIIWAVKDVSFEVKRGEVLGIIGANGAGKSTLLKLLAQITQPSSGQIQLHGRVASLLEVGTGFHPDLTGRENIYLNGTILGMTKKEIDSKFDEIIDFSGVEKFIDTPVKRYSSGMGVRLAFSVAAHLEPEILLIDEVLAVGDAEFQKKCLGKMDDVAKQGRTVLFVSHRMSAVKSLCKRGILLSNGQLSFDGPISNTIRTYISESLESFSLSKTFNITKNDITLKRVAISKEEIYSGDSFELEFGFEKSDYLVYQADITFHLVDEYGHLVFVGSTGRSNFKITLNNSNINLTCEIPDNLMNEGTYTISRLLFVKNRGTILNEIKDSFSFRILPKKQELGWMGEKEEGIIAPKLDWSTMN